MILYLIRHGQTTGNRDHKIQGWSEDVVLSEKGEMQARGLHEALKNKHYDKIYASDIKRARQTAGIVFGENADIHYDARLREVRNDCIAGLYRDEVIEKYGNVYIECARSFNYTRIGGESAASLLGRTASFLSDMEKEPEDARIAAVSHGGTITAFVSTVTEMPLSSQKVRIDNCSITKLVYSNGIWLLAGMNRILY